MINSIKKIFNKLKNFLFLSKKDIYNKLKQNTDNNLSIIIAVEKTTKIREMLVVVTHQQFSEYLKTANNDQKTQILRENLDLLKIRYMEVTELMEVIKEMHVILKKQQIIIDKQEDIKIYEDFEEKINLKFLKIGVLSQYDLDQEITLYNESNALAENTNK